MEKTNLESRHCSEHDVYGCQVTACRAARLGISVERYHQLVIEPAAQTARWIERRNESIRRATGRN